MSQGWDYWEENKAWEEQTSSASSWPGSKNLFIAVAGGVVVGATALYLTKKLWMSKGGDVAKNIQSRRTTSLLEKSISTTTKAEHRSYYESDIPQILRASMRDGMFGQDTHPVAIYYDLDAQKETLLALQSAFPSHFFHAFAVKANPLPFVLKEAIHLGMGLEAASYGEMIQGLRQGCPAERIVFDSPAKSNTELEEAISLGVRLNADNFDEVERISQILSRRPRPHSASLHIGIRVNPLVGAGTIAALSVSDSRSKFGVELSESTRETLIQSFLHHDFLDGLHVHVGSQGCSLQQLAEGARRIVELADEIDRRHGGPRIRYLDIGGGLPVNFKSSPVSPTFADYAQELRRHVPSLWSNTQRTVITEYGRTVCAKAGWVATTVEYIKPIAGGADRVAIVQAGADLFVRSCYAQASFPLRLTAHSRVSGEPVPVPAGGGSDGQGAARYDVAGPLCFGGDKIALGVELGEVQPGDVVVVHDSGANTLALWSRHCSRLAPPVYGYTRAAAGTGGAAAGTGGADGQRGGERLEIRLLKPAERLEDMLHFWDPAPPLPPLRRVVKGLAAVVARWLNGLGGASWRT